MALHRAFGDVHYRGDVSNRKISLEEKRGRRPLSRRQATEKSLRVEAALPFSPVPFRRHVHDQALEQPCSSAQVAAIVLTAIDADSIEPSDRILMSLDGLPVLMKPEERVLRSIRGQVLIENNQCETLDQAATMLPDKGFIGCGRSRVIRLDFDPATEAIPAGGAVD